MFVYSLRLSAHPSDSTVYSLPTRVLTIVPPLLINAASELERKASIKTEAAAIDYIPTQIRGCSRRCATLIGQEKGRKNGRLQNSNDLQCANILHSVFKKKKNLNF